MVPPRLDAASVQAKPRRLSDLAADLDEVGAVGEERLRRERLTLHALGRIITQVVETASSAAAHVVASASTPSTTYRATFTDLAGVGVIDGRLAASLGAAAGMRNLPVHHYAGVDLAIVASAAPMLRRDADAFVRQVGRWLTEQP